MKKIREEIKKLPWYISPGQLHIRVGKNDFEIVYIVKKGEGDNEEMWELDYLVSDDTLDGAIEKMRLLLINKHLIK